MTNTIWEHTILTNEPTQTVIVPLIVAAVLYFVLSFVLLPLYRRYRADISRYSQYAPLTSTLQSTTSIFGDYVPDALRPRSIREKIGNFLVRKVLPFMFKIRDRGSNLEHDNEAGGSDEDGGLFDEESGERMVGFDMNEGRRGAPNRSRSRARQNYALHAALEEAQRQQVEHSDRRLSRELEEGFIDDSGSEQSDEEVTVGRRRLSMAATT